MVDSYKRLQVPPGIRAEIETIIAIEVEEINAPGIDYSSVKEFLICQPLPGVSVHQKKVVKNNKPTLMVDFSFVRELIPPALPKVNTTYIYREKVTVVNEWHFMLLQLRGLSYGILFYVPGTELWTFVDISVSGNHHQPALAGDSVELPLDLIAWQIFDFFTRRVSNHTLDIKEGFAPFSLSCPDGILAKLLSSLFLDLGLPSQRQIGISKENQVPIKYREQITTLASERATPISVDSMLTCASCFGLFAHINSLSLCSVCSETSEDYQRNSNNLPDREHLQVREVDGRRNSKGSNAIVCELPRFSIGHLPQSFHFARKRDVGLVDKRGQGGRLSKGELRRAKKSRTKKSSFSGPSRPTNDRPGTSRSSINGRRGN